MKKYEIKFEWEIRDTRNVTGGYRTGTSRLIVNAKSQAEVINRAIFFAENVPSWELLENNIDINEYREGNICTYYYMTKISNVIYIKVIK